MEFPNDGMKLNEWSGFLFSFSYEQHFALRRFAGVLSILSLLFDVNGLGTRCSLFSRIFLFVVSRLYLKNTVRRRWKRTELLKQKSAGGAVVDRVLSPGYCLIQHPRIYGHSMAEKEW